MLQAEPFKSVLVVTGVPTVVDGDNGTFMYLDLDDEGQLRTRLHPRQHALLETLQAQRVRAIYYLRSTRDGRVLLTSQLTSIKSHQEETLNRVEGTGKVVQMSKTDLLAVVRIFSERLKEPFCLHLHAENDMLNTALDYFSVRILGHVGPEGKLVVDRMDNTRVVIPQKFQGWKPDMSWRKKYFAEPTASPDSTQFSSEGQPSIHHEL